MPATHCSQARQLRRVLEEARASSSKLATDATSAAAASGGAASPAATGTTEDAELSVIKPMLEARVVWCSPLTRAMQTSLLGLQPILDSGASLYLKPSIRERKNFGGARGAADTHSHAHARSAHELPTDGLVARTHHRL